MSVAHNRQRKDEIYEEKCEESFVVNVAGGETGESCFSGQQ